MIQIEELKKRMENYGPYEWFHSEEVAGFDSTKEKETNRKKWFNRETNVSDDGDEPPDEILSDYINDCLSERKLIMDRGQIVPEELQIDYREYLSSVLFLICELGSSYAANTLCVWNEFINFENAQTCLSICKDRFESTDEAFILDILRDFILELFKKGPLWSDSEGLYSSVLDENSNKFLDTLFNQGYRTV